MGLAKTGTTYLQALLADHREQLATHGVRYPFLRPGGMFHAAVEVRGSQAKFGLDPKLIEGSWLALCQQAREHDGVTVISHEILGGATREEISAALEPLAGLRVEVIVTARDLGRQATAHWQEEVKLGSTASFAEFERDQFRADTGPGTVAKKRPHFWHAQDYAAALGRWAGVVGADRTQLVVCPPAGAPTDELWRRFCAAVGIDPSIIDAGHVSTSQTNASLGRVQVAVLRAVTAELDGAIVQPAYSRVVKQVLAERVLARHGGTAPRTPQALVELFTEVASRWGEDIAGAGYRVHGNLDELLPSTPPRGEPHPDDVGIDQRLEVAAEALAELVLSAATNSSASGRPADRQATSSPEPPRRRRGLRRRRRTMGP